MYKVGDKIVCKSFPKNVNGIIRDKDPNMTIGQIYEIIEIRSDDWSNLQRLQMLRIMGELGPCWYWSDYFYNIKEMRKIKIERMMESVSFDINAGDELLF